MRIANGGNKSEIIPILILAENPKKIPIMLGKNHIINNRNPNDPFNIFFTALNLRPVFPFKDFRIFFVKLADQTQAQSRNCFKRLRK